MPETIYFGGRVRLVATEQELLDFANVIREAGGANVLEALLPSVAGNPESCVIATSLNFGCRVSILGNFEDGEARWVMFLPRNLSQAQLLAIQEAVEGIDEAKFVSGPSEPYIRLPRHIGNAATAFDRGLAFQNYAVV